MNAPAVYRDRNNHTTIAVLVGRKFVAHIPMESSLRIQKTRLANFELDWMPLLSPGGAVPYPVNTAAGKFLAASHLPMTARARALLKKLHHNGAAAPINEEDLLETENEMATTEKTETAAETTAKAPKGKATKAPKAEAKAPAAKADSKASKGKTEPKGKAAPPKGAKTSQKGSQTTSKGGEGKGGKREAQFQDGQKIKLLAKENPKREGTLAWDKWEAYENGMTVGAYLEKGVGARSTLKHDVEKGYIEIK